jgi:hypothetical protein
MYYKHLSQKSPREQRKRISFVRCAIDLLKNSRVSPEIFVIKRTEYYRFYGKTNSGEAFAVQVMKDRKDNRYFMSCFPAREAG